MRDNVRTFYFPFYSKPLKEKTNQTFITSSRQKSPCFVTKSIISSSRYRSDSNLNICMVTLELMMQNEIDFLSANSKNTSIDVFS